MGTIWPFRKKEAQAPASMPTSLPETLPASVPAALTPSLPDALPEPEPATPSVPPQDPFPELPLRPAKHVYGPNLVDGLPVVISLNDKHPYSVATKAEVHACALLEHTGKLYAEDFWITGVQLNAYYRGWLKIHKETPVPWNSLAAEVRRITGKGKKTTRVNGKRHPIFFIEGLLKADQD
jgi:hypothetical protein